jgi:hypothetical protein
MGLECDLGSRDSKVSEVSSQGLGEEPPRVVVVRSGPGEHRHSMLGL